MTTAKDSNDNPASSEAQPQEAVALLAETRLDLERDLREAQEAVAPLEADRVKMVAHIDALHLKLERLSADAKTSPVAQNELTLTRNNLTRALELLEDHDRALETERARVTAARSRLEDAHPMTVTAERRTPAETMEAFKADLERAKTDLVRLEGERDNLNTLLQRHQALERDAKEAAALAARKGDLDKASTLLDKASRIESQVSSAAGMLKQHEVTIAGHTEDMTKLERQIELYAYGLEVQGYNDRMEDCAQRDAALISELYSTLMRMKRDIRENRFEWTRNRMRLSLLTRKYGCELLTNPYTERARNEVAAFKKAMTNAGFRVGSIGKLEFLSLEGAVYGTHPMQREAKWIPVNALLEEIQEWWNADLSEGKLQ